jgi:hypothetical protein
VQSGGSGTHGHAVADTTDPGREFLEPLGLLAEREDA